MIWDDGGDDGAEFGLILGSGNFSGKLRSDTLKYLRGFIQTQELYTK